MPTSGLLRSGHCGGVGLQTRRSHRRISAETCGVDLCQVISPQPSLHHRRVMLSMNCQLSSGTNKVLWSFSVRFGN